MQTAAVEPMVNLRDGIRNPPTKYNHERRLKEFLDFSGLEGKDLDEKARGFLRRAAEDYGWLVAKITQWDRFQKGRCERREISEETLPNHITPLRLFCDMNNPAVNWRRLNRLLPRARSYASYRALELEEIAKLLQYGDRKMKPLVLTTLSSGIRLGAWDNLVLRDLTNVKKGVGQAARARILLPGIGGNTAQGVARSLLQFAHRFSIIGADSDKYNVRFGFNYAERVYLLPAASEDGYVDEIVKIIRKEKIDLVVPSSDPEVYVISKHREELGTRTFLPSHEVISLTKDKWLTYLSLENTGMQAKSILIKSRADVGRCFSRIEGPVWLRLREGAGGVRGFVAHNAKQAEFWIDYWNGYGKFIASEVVEGRNLSWIGLFKNGTLVAEGGYERLRYFMDKISPTGVTGNVSAGATLCDEELNRVAVGMVRTLDRRPNGVFTLDLKGKDGDLKLTETNSGRFHMSFYVYTKAGLNLPYYYARLALEDDWEPSKVPELKEGVVTIRNTDNDPLFITKDNIGEDILIP